MSPYPSSTCATRGSVKSSPSATKGSSLKPKIKTKSNSLSVDTFACNVSSPKPLNQTTNDQASTPSIVFPSDDAPSYKSWYSQVDFKHLSLPSSPALIVFSTHNRATSEHDHSVLGCKYASTSTVYFNTQCAPAPDDNYSLNRFLSKDACEPSLSSASAEESIQRHTISKKAYLDAFDEIFYQA